MSDRFETPYSRRNWLKQLSADIQDEIAEQADNKEEFWLEFSKSEWSPTDLGNLITEVAGELSIKATFRYRELSEVLLARCVRFYNSLTNQESFKQLVYWFQSGMKKIAQTFRNETIGASLIAIFGGSKVMLQTILVSGTGSVAVFILLRLWRIFQSGQSIGQMLIEAKQYISNLMFPAASRITISNRRDLVLFKFSPA